MATGAPDPECQLPAPLAVRSWCKSLRLNSSLSRKQGRPSAADYLDKAGPNSPGADAEASRTQLLSALQDMEDPVAAPAAAAHTSNAPALPCRQPVPSSPEVAACLLLTSKVACAALQGKVLCR